MGLWVYGMVGLLLDTILTYWSKSLEVTVVFVCLFVCLFVDVFVCLWVVLGALFFLIKKEPKKSRLPMI